MVEIIVNDERDKQQTTPMQDINNVYEHCKFGRFHIRLLFASFLGYIANILVTSTSSYLLPSAECDLNMNLRQKGLLNAIPYIGTFFSSVISGFLIDTFGRIFFIRIGFGGIFIFTVIAASSQTFEMLVTAKFFEGCLFGACMSASSSLISEFCHSSIRDRVMLCYSAIAAIGQIICPAMAWGILVQDWKHSLFNGYIVLNVWNYYLYAMSLWSFGASICYSTLPESPKYLVTQEKYAEAKKILIKMYIETTGRDATTFPMPDLWNAEIKEAKLRQNDSRLKRGFKHQISTGFHNIKPLFKKPLLGYLVMLCGMQFIIVGMYNVVRLWFPQLSTIVEHYKLGTDRNLCDLLDIYTNNLNTRSNLTSEICVPFSIGNVCTCYSSQEMTKSRLHCPRIFEVYFPTSSLDLPATETKKTVSKTLRDKERDLFNPSPSIRGALTFNCINIGIVCLFPYAISWALISKVGKKFLLELAGLFCFGTTFGKVQWALSTAETYINGMIIGTVCIVPYFVTSVLVNKVGKKILLASFGIICCVASLCLQWSASNTMMVALFSVDIAIGQIIKTLVQLVLVETFSTSMRSLALSIVMLFARIGTLVGNIGFPLFLDLGCSVPFYTMAGMMTGVTVLSFFLPKGKEK